MKDIVKNDDGSYPAFAWPGGYPIVYMENNDDVICPDCANKNNDTWHIVGWFIFYEGPSRWCGECNTEMESAYGDPDEENE